MNFVWLIVLLAWMPDGTGTSDSGRFGDPSLAECHSRSQKFSLRHDTPLQLCIRITKAHWRIIANADVQFDFATTAEIGMEEEVARLRAALRAIGRWHRGKTADSQRVRKIIKEATGSSP